VLLLLLDEAHGAFEFLAAAGRLFVERDDGGVFGFELAQALGGGGFEDFDALLLAVDGGDGALKLARAASGYGVKIGERGVFGVDFV
jgi:hypothetical protein